MRTKPFTPEEEAHLLKIYASTPKGKLLKIFPKHSLREIHNSVWNYNALVKSGKIAGEVIMKDPGLRYAFGRGKERSLEPEIFSQPVITEDIYAWRFGFELKPHSLADR